MTTPDPILDQLLVAVRATKRRRQWRRGTLITASVAAAAFLLLPRHRDPGPTLAASPPPAPPPAAENTLAVWVWHEDRPVLEELAASDLEDVQLDFGLEPAVTYPGDLWAELRN